MTPEQIAAATVAMNGTTPHEFLLTLFGIGGFILLIWMSAIIFGYVQAMMSKRMDLKEIGLWGPMALAVIILVAGLLIF